MQMYCLCVALRGNKTKSMKLGITEKTKKWIIINVQSKIYCFLLQGSQQHIDSSGKAIGGCWDCKSLFSLDSWILSISECKVFTIVEI